MRLEVFCQDRIGLARELLDLLVERSIDLRGIEIAPIGRIYLNFSAIAFEQFSQLMAEIRRIPGVTDVRTIAYMPSEREHRAERAADRHAGTGVLYRYEGQSGAGEPGGTKPVRSG